MSKSSINVVGLGMNENVSVESVNSTLYEVMKSFCEKKNLDISKHRFMKGNSELDLSLPYRLSGLSNNSKVEIDNVVTEKKRSGSCRVAVQLDDGTRVAERFPIRYKLYDVLVFVEKTTNKNILKRKKDEAGEKIYMKPKINYMNNVISGEEALSKKSLKGIGLKDKSSGVLRLSFENSKMNWDSIASIVEFHIQESIDRIKKIKKKGGDQPQLDFLDENMLDDSSIEKGDTKQNEIEKVEQKTIKYEDDSVKDIKVFHISKMNENTSSKEEQEEFQEDDFKISTEELRVMLANIEKKKKSDSFLKTKKIRDLENKKKERIYNEAMVRVRFPDGIILQGTFSPDAKINDVKKFVKAMLQNQDASFYLYITPPIQKFDKDGEKSLKELRLLPAVLMNIGKNSESKLEIKHEYTSYIQGYTTESIPRNINPLSEKSSNLKAPSTTNTSSKSDSSSERNTSKKTYFPKWYKK